MKSALRVSLLWFLKEKIGLLYICRALPSISKRACGSSAEGKLHCETEQCQITSFILSHLMRAIACTHASTHTTGLIRLKSNMHHFCSWHWLSGTFDKKKWKKEQKHAFKKQHTPFLFIALITWDIGMEKMKKEKKTSNWIVDIFH